MENLNLLAILDDAKARAKSAQQAVSNLTLSESLDTTKRINLAAKSFYHDPGILEALSELAQPLADSYLQIVADFDDESRITWAGTAHEIRELLRKILEHLAPESLVVKEPWYIQEPTVAGPTQKQRVRYILVKNGGDSKQQKVAQDIELVDDKIGSLVRDVYGRASDAAHRSKSKAEAYKILHYFYAFAYDLLDIG